ncbi:MAG: hypothetical protein HRU22_18005, partial [Gammaproteobacteria bacterium]|nr:hypothetical protein [Gammaproteobacteria bacterium]
MNLNGLNFDNMPPFEVPRGFFLTAPLFGILSALIIAFSGEQLWVSRWTPATLALTHAMVLGVISITMFGALFQLLPVLGGITIPRVKLVAYTVLSALSLGTSLLVAGFYFSNYELFVPAISLLGMVLIGFILLILDQIRKYNVANESIRAIKTGIFSLVLVLAIATLLLADYLLGTSFNGSKVLTDYHATWGLVGWISLIIIGVSFQVIPMFHVAPAFPKWCTNLLVGGLFSALIINFICSFFSHLVMIGQASTLLIKLLLVVYGMTALRLLTQRKRKIKDPSITCWQIGFVTLIGVSVMGIVASFIDLPTELSTELSFALVVLFVFGWIISVIMAMTIKIMPFLAYLHLQQLCGSNFEAFALLPNVHQLLSKKKMNLLLMSHISSLIALAITLIAPSFYGLLAASTLIQFSYLALI